MIILSQACEHIYLDVGVYFDCQISFFFLNKENLELKLIKLCMQQPFPHTAKGNLHALIIILMTGAIISHKIFNVSEKVSYTFLSSSQYCELSKTRYNQDNKILCSKNSQNQIKGSFCNMGKSTFYFKPPSLQQISNCNVFLPF